VIERRRAIAAIIALGASRVAWPQASPNAYRIGFLVPRSSANFTNRTEAFQAGMRELGYVEGKNLKIEWRFADG
jgi:putative ABC transport system substrate-binding protein